MTGCNPLKTEYLVAGNNSILGDTGIKHKSQSVKIRNDGHSMEEFISKCKSRNAATHE